ncbi:MAG: hypothetical protein ACOC91_01945 [bacterium]
MARVQGSANRLYASVLAASFLFWLGGSAIAISIVTRTDTTPFYSLSEIMTAKRDGVLPAEVHGGPSKSATAGTVLAPLRLPSRVGGGRLAPFEPRADGRAATRMVLLFNARYLSARAACREPARTGARRMDGKLEVFAVLCHGGRYFSQAHLRDSAVLGETDPRYARSMMQLFLALMPSKGEAERDNDDAGRN